MKPTKGFSRSFVNYLMSLVSFSVMWGIGEVILKHHGKNIPIFSSLPTGAPYPSEYSSYLPFTLPRNAEMKHFYVPYQFNRLGFRGPEIQAKQEAGFNGRRRLVLLGDSFTFGWRMGEQDTFPAKLQNFLNMGGFTYDVINAGYHSGYSPDAYYASLVEEWDYFSPDLVLVALFMGNDVTDLNDNIWLKIDERNLPTKLKTVRNYFDYEGKLNLAKKWYYQIPLLRNSRIFIGLMKLIESFEVNRKDRLAGKNVFLEVISGIHAMLVEKKVEHLFILIPPFGGESFNLNDSALKDTKRFITEKLGARVLDLSETFAKQPDTSKLVIPGDGHFSLYGNGLVAEELYQSLLSSSLIRK